jgi:hypothetical protein
MDPSVAEQDKEKNLPHGSPSPEFEKGHVAPEGPVNPSQDNDNTIAILELVHAKDVHHPMHWPAWKRWGIILLYVCLSYQFI